MFTDDEYNNMEQSVPLSISEMKRISAALIEVAYSENGENDDYRLYEKVEYYIRCWSLDHP